MAQIQFYLIALLFFFPIVGFCNKPAGAEIMKSNTTFHQRTTMLSFLALGDSYTIGKGLQVDQSWPAQLAVQLRKDKLEIDAPVIVAATGWTTKDLLKAMGDSGLEKPYDLVTLLIGANDQFQGFGEYVYSVEFEKLLVKAIDLAGGNSNRVIVISIPDYSVTKFGKMLGPAGIRVAIDNFNIINKRFAENKGAHYVNITEISRRAGKDSTLTAPDGLHPSAIMYAEWVKIIEPVALSAFGKKVQ